MSARARTGTSSRKLSFGSHPYERIAKKLPPDENGHKIDRRSIAHHAKEHMDLQRTAIREELEEEARAAGQNIETGAQGAKTDRGILKVLVAKGFDDVIRGISTVEPKDLIQMIKLLNELNSNASTARAEENEIALRTFVRAIENICEPERSRPSSPRRNASATWTT